MYIFTHRYLNWHQLSTFCKKAAGIGQQRTARNNLRLFPGSGVLSGRKDG
jgi:hypothetical protein